MAKPRLSAAPADRIQPQRRRVPRKRARGNRFLLRASKLGLLVLLWMAIVGSVVLGYFALTLPDTGELTRADRRPSVTIHASYGSLLPPFGILYVLQLFSLAISPILPLPAFYTDY